MLVVTFMEQCANLIISALLPSSMACLALFSLFSLIFLRFSNVLSLKLNAAPSNTSIGFILNDFNNCIHFLV